MKALVLISSLAVSFLSAIGQKELAQITGLML
jgi:hypothetical protein